MHLHHFMLSYCDGAYDFKNFREGHLSHCFRPDPKFGCVVVLSQIIRTSRGETRVKQV